MHWWVFCPVWLRNIFFRTCNNKAYLSIIISNPRENHGWEENKVLVFVDLIMIQLFQTLGCLSSINNYRKLTDHGLFYATIHVRNQINL